MTTFGLQELQQFTSSLKAGFDECETAEGLECATLDHCLDKYRAICDEYALKLRNWAHDVFVGKVAYDAQVEQAWLDEINKARNRAKLLRERAKQFEPDCYTFEYLGRLESSLHLLDWLVQNWATPKLAVGPAARRHITLDQAAIREINQRMDTLSKLPPGWQPPTAQQRHILQIQLQKRSGR